MARIKRAGPPVLIVAVVAGIIGYILGCTRTERERESQALAEGQEQVAQSDQASQESDQADQDDGAVEQYSPVKARARDFYTPNSEDLGPNEMR